MSDVPAHLIGGANAQLPTGFHLLAGERVKSVEEIPWHRPVKTVDADTLIANMAGVEDVEDVGEAGLAVASRALDGERRGEGLYEAEFARDALMMAKFGHDRFPKLTEATVKRLAQVQGAFDRPGTDTEEVGRIPHEIRPEGDPMRETMTAKFGWEWPYFGSVDATPLFVSAAMRADNTTPGLLEETVRHEDGSTATIGESVGLAVLWILNRMDSNPQHFVETQPASNKCWQVWADSPDAYHHADGRLARGLVAAIEVQAYAFDALTEVADFLEFIDNPSIFGKDFPWRAEELRAKAEALRESVLDHFWVEQEDGAQFLAIGMERFEAELKPLAVRSINMGLTLNTQLLTRPEDQWRVDAIVNELTDPAKGMNTPNGIRTLADDSPRFRPQAYHNGTIWPWTNYEVAAGLHYKHGRDVEAREIRSHVDHACSELNCFPEYYPGSDKRNVVFNEAIVWTVAPDGNGGTFEHQAMQPGQLYQGWTVFGHDLSRRLDREITVDLAPTPIVTNTHYIETPARDGVGSEPPAPSLG